MTPRLRAGLRPLKMTHRPGVVLRLLKKNRRAGPHHRLLAGLRPTRTMIPMRPWRKNLPRPAPACPIRHAAH